ncbi:hypothetical protein Bbelb_413920 [Branchiostoma belcheri]|nr:hypothetical protein Bbelb_413920 [Branchiostoma belcheri]
MCKDGRGCVRMGEDGRGWLRMCKDGEDWLGCVRMCKDSGGWERMCKDSRGCVRMYNREPPLTLLGKLSLGVIHHLSPQHALWGSIHLSGREVLWVRGGRPIMAETVPRTKTAQQKTRSADQTHPNDTPSGGRT